MDTSNEKQIREITDELTELLLAKNHDYGNAALQSPILMPRIGVEWAILVRLGDKIARLKNLLSGAGAQVQESIDDTLMDMAGYCVLLMVVRKQMKKEDNDA